MTVTMSSGEGDNTKNLSTDSNDETKAAKSDASQDVKEQKPETDKAPENNAANAQDKDKDDGKVETAVPKKGGEVKDDTKDEKPKNNVSEKGDNADKKTEQNDDEEGTEDSEKDDEEDEGSEKGEKGVPLLDQPLEKSGKRERKNVNRFNEEFTPEAKDNVKVEIPNGSGTQLGNIPRIDASISRFKNDDMKLLHRILFKTPGKSIMIKKNIKKFNGFDFKKDSDDYSKKLTSMQKYEVKQLKSICEMLDLQKTGTKDDIIERIIDFLLEPKDSGKSVGGGRPKRTAAVKANNRGYSSHDNYSSDERHGGRTTRDKGKRSNLKDDSSSQSDEDFQPSDVSDEKPRVTKRKRGDRKPIDTDDEEDSDELVESGGSSDDDSDFQEEPKNKRKKVAKTNNKAKGKTPSRRGRKPATAKKTKAGKKRNKESSEEEDDDEDESDHKEEEGSSSSEDEPLSKKAKSAQPPTDDEIKSYVKEILEGANLEQITMKTVCQQVYAHYPDFDLAHKKDFIKTTVKSLIST